MTIEVVEAHWDEGIAWADALGPLRRRAATLVGAFERQAISELGQAGWLLLSRAAALGNFLLGSHYRHEASALADLAGCDTADVLGANLAYDINAGFSVGCSTFATGCRAGALHARNLDWDFPRGLLRRHTIVVKVRCAPSGDYALVTWPGFFGALTAVAPGRFSVSVNFVRHDEATGRADLAGRAAVGAWPVPWAVRQALDDAPSFAAAVRLLSTIPLLSPVLLVVAGTRAGEKVVIERSTDGAARHQPRRGPAWITNHYAWTRMQAHDLGEDIMCSADRFAFLDEALERPPRSSMEALDLLESEELLQSNTQHQVAMCAATGELVVRVPGVGEVTVEV